MIKVIMISFSSGLDSATIRVIATRAVFDMICLPLYDNYVPCLYIISYLFLTFDRIK